MKHLDRFLDRFGATRLQFANSLALAAAVLAMSPMIACLAP